MLYNSEKIGYEIFDLLPVLAYNLVDKVILGGIMKNFDNGFNLIKYNNDMNKVAFHKFNSVELNLFYTICSVMKERGSTEITFSFDEVKRLSKTKFKNEQEFISRLRSTYRKLLNLVFGFEDENKIIEFVLFTRYEIDIANKRLSIKTNKDFEFILNNLTKNFTVFELESFSKLNSSYSKNLFRLLKQYKSTGFYISTIDEFRRVMDIPDSYRMRAIDQRVLKPIIEELPAIFELLNIEKVKGKVGNKITHIRITFKPEIQETLEVEQEVLKVIKETSFNCPVCNQELFEICGANGCFYGHKNYLNSPCKLTFNTVSDIMGYKDIYKDNNF